MRFLHGLGTKRLPSLPGLAWGLQTVGTKLSSPGQQKRVFK